MYWRTRKYTSESAAPSRQIESISYNGSTLSKSALICSVLRAALIVVGSRATLRRCCSKSINFVSTHNPENRRAIKNFRLTFLRRGTVMFSVTVQRGEGARRILKVTREIAIKVFVISGMLCLQHV